jgi:hypothetical protein
VYARRREQVSGASSKAILLELSLGRRLIQANREWIDEVRGGLGPPKTPRPEAQSS